MHIKGSVLAAEYKINRAILSDLNAKIQVASRMDKSQLQNRKIEILIRQMEILSRFLQTDKTTSTN